MRDPRKLEAFQLADALTIEVYRGTRCLPGEERYGLQSQMRRAAVSVPTNLVEGCTRPSLREYQRGVAIALASACELRYLIGLASRLDYLDPPRGQDLERACGRVVRALQALAIALAKL